MISPVRNGALAALILGVALALGVATGGYLIGRGLFAARASDRYVTVRGFSEREVKANLAMWPIVFNATGNDLAGVQASLDSSAKKIAAFLQTRGFPASEFNVSSPRVTDREAQEGRGRADRPIDRYVSEQTVTLRSQRVEAVKGAIRRSGDLIREGVALVRSYEYNTSKRRLDAAGREQTAAAQHPTASVRDRGDSNSRVGAIRNAQQGYFDIQDRDAFSPEFKKVRVVTTIQYFLDK
jgi:hypothetical protein